MHRIVASVAAPGTLKSKDMRTPNVIAFPSPKFHINCTHFTSDRLSSGRNLYRLKIKLKVFICIKMTVSDPFGLTAGEPSMSFLKPQLAHNFFSV